MSILKREILFPGKTEIGELEPDTKLIYHFETVIYKNKGSEPIVIDDSRKYAQGQPVETLYGKQFKLPIWESCLTSMRKGERCRLTVRDDPVTHYICLNYAVTIKCFRKNFGLEPTSVHGKEEHDNGGPCMTSHNCSMSIRNSPYRDLNDMIMNPPEIFEFTFELVDVIPPESYTKEIWQMSDQEKISMLPKFREQGNKSYSERNYDEAASCYGKGLSLLESLIAKERPRDSEWLRLDDMKTPFLLNLAQVRLAEGKFYDCIRHTDEVLRRDPENIKALFRRARAHAGVWNLEEAKEDFRKCIEFDKGMSKIVTKCMQDLRERETLKDREDRERYSKMFSNGL